MKDRKIVRRTYTKDHGKVISKIFYAVAPRDANGMECFDVDIEKAYLFREDVWLTSSFSECTINGNDIYGDFAYKQEIVTVKLVVENN